jgi:ubiquinone/menaquinone biosynthesis C-methylase UbiE
MKQEILCEYTTCALCTDDSQEVIANGYDYEYWTSEQKFSFVQCKKCGHIYLNPRPVSNEAEQIYPKNYYTLTGRHLATSNKLIAYMKSKIITNRLAFFNEIFKKPINLLEIGCGDCALLIELKKKYPHINCTGVDITFSEERMTICADVGVNLIRGKIEEIELPGNYYNLVIMNQLIEHLWDPQDVIKKIHHCLASEGMISIETVNISGYDRQFFSKACWGGYYFPRHLNLFSSKTLRQFLLDNGFEIQKQYSLLAPVIWTYSIHAFLCPGPEEKESWTYRFFSDSNPLCLGFFAIIDIIAILSKFTTSNQKIIARKQR